MLGPALGLILLGFISKLFNSNLLFLIFSIFPFIGFLILLKLRNIKVKQKINKFKLLKKSFKSKTLLKLVSIWFSFYFIYGSTIGFIPIKIKDAFGIEYVGILSSLFYIIPFLSSYFLGRLSDKIGRKKLLMYSYLVSFSGLIFLYVSNLSIFLLIGVILLALREAMIRPLIPALTGDVSTEKNLEFINSLTWTSQQVGIVSSLILSRIWYGNIIYPISLIVIFISSIIFLRLFKKGIKEIKLKLSKEISS